MKDTIRSKQGELQGVGTAARRRSLFRGAVFALFIASLVFLPSGGGAARVDTASANAAGGAFFFPMITTATDNSTPVLRIPFLDTDDVYQNGFNRMAITWFGKISRFTNSTDMRIGYNREMLVIDLATIDRALYYDTTNPSPNESNNWDAAMVYLRIPATERQGEQFLRLDGQLSGAEDRAAYQAAFRNNGGGWTRVSLPFTTITGWRGSVMNGDPEDRGWNITYQIPFSSLGLSGAPENLSAWGMGVKVYDRDWNEDGVATAQVWPEAFQETDSGTFGRVTFGYPGYTPPARSVAGTLTIRHGSNGITVEDGSVGGYATCGGSLHYWNEWGNQVYDTGDESEVAVIQNQRDLADFPCFSRYYVAFPIHQLPKGKVILSAKLILHHFGNSDPTKARPSYIQVMRVNKPWSESTITWNNAPQPAENYPGTTVDPLELTYRGPDVPRTWDVTRALVDVYKLGEEKLSLAMYESDRAYHSGKYFRSSETISFGAIPPTLVIEWGEP